MTAISLNETVQSTTGWELHPQLKDRFFLAAARTQLDADSLGLEKIKKRSTEYLAVVRVKELELEREIAEEQKHMESLALEEGARAKAESKTKPVTRPAERQSWAMSLFRFVKNFVQKRQQQNQAVSVKPRKVNRKSIKGPILL